MSWSISYIGTPEKISKALKSHSETLTGKSKEEFDAALPHLDALVSQNVNTNYPIALRLNANGHGYNDNNQVNASIENIGILLD
jgi:hypothetical protein